MRGRKSAFRGRNFSQLSTGLCGGGNQRISGEFGVAGEEISAPCPPNGGGEISVYSPRKLRQFEHMTDSLFISIAAWTLKSAPKPTGDIWEPSKTHPATVPVPLPVVMVRVDGPFTALDRKLWLLLLHNAWDELEFRQAVSRNFCRRNIAAVPQIRAHRPRHARQDQARQDGRRDRSGGAVG